MRISDWSSDVCSSDLGALTDALRWERLDQAAAEGNAAVMRVAGNGLPDEQAALARAYADFIAEPGEPALRFPPGARRRRIASLGLARLARKGGVSGKRVSGRVAPRGPRTNKKKHSAHTHSD